MRVCADVTMCTCEEVHVWISAGVKMFISACVRMQVVMICNVQFMFWFYFCRTLRSARLGQTGKGWHGCCVLLVRALSGSVCPGLVRYVSCLSAWLAPLSPSCPALSLAWPRRFPLSHGTYPVVFTPVTWESCQELSLSTMFCFGDMPFPNRWRLQ